LFDGDYESVFNELYAKSFADRKEKTDDLVQVRMQGPGGRWYYQPFHANMNSKNNIGLTVSP
jgi:hypothetical protein